MIFPSDYDAPLGMVSVISFFHYKMEEVVSMFSNGNCISSISHTKGVWQSADDGYTRIFWLNRPHEMLTPNFAILNMAKNGLPIIEASGRLGNQYIWLAYALGVNADKIITNQKDLLHLDCGIEVEYDPNTPFDGKSWITARKWPNILENIGDLRKIIVPRGVKQNDAIALHVRMGDKIGMAEYMQPSREFYEKALYLMPKDLAVNVYSDNISGCKQYVEGLRDEINYIDGCSPREDFLNIYSHTHHIIPDTTFSWLASLISPFRKLAIMQWNPNHGHIFKFPDLITIKS